MLGEYCEPVPTFPSLQELLEFFDREASVTDDAAHGVFIDRVVARNRENATPVTHDNVLTLSDDFETGLCESLEQLADG